MGPSSSVTRSASSLLASRLAVAGIGLAFLGVSARLLSVEQMAVFAVYNTLCGLMSVIGSLGLLTTCIRSVPGLAASRQPGDRHEAARLLRLAITVYAAGASATAAAILIAARPLARLLLKDPELGADLRRAALAALCFGLYEACQLLLTSLQQFGPVGRYNVAAALVQRGLSLALWFAFGLGGYLAGFAVGSLAGAALGLRRIIPAMTGAGAGGHAEPASGRGATGWIRYSFPFYVDGYLRYFYMQADQLLVAVFLSPAELSIYFIAKRFIAYGQVLVTSLVDPLTTKVSELRQLNREALPGAFAATSRYFVFLFVPLSVLLSCASPFLLAVVGGETYAAGVAPLALLFLSLPFFAGFSRIAGFLYALGPPADRLRTNLVSSATQAAGILALMPWMGLPGLALARIGGFGAASLYARRLLRGHLPGRPEGDSHKPAAGALRCLGPVAIMALMVTGPHMVVGRAMMIPLYAGPAAALCLALCLRYVLAPADRRALAGLVPGRGRGAAALRALLLGRRADSADAGGLAI